MEQRREEECAQTQAEGKGEGQRLLRDEVMAEDIADVIRASGPESPPTRCSTHQEDEDEAEHSDSERSCARYFRQPRRITISLILLLAFAFTAPNVSLVILRLAAGSGHRSRNASRAREILPPENRISALNPNRTFSFVHVSKAAGSSWIGTLRGLPLNVCPDQLAGAEFSVWYQTSAHCKGSDYHMVSLRSPRHHVWSLFTECKYDKWGRKVTNGTGFPRNGTTEAADERDFEAFLDHFLPVGEDAVHDYNCYHPANYQSRHLATRVKKPHGVRDMPRDEYRFEPNLTRSISTYREQDFVPVVELFHESSCLLYHRLGSRAPAKALRYLERRCRCPRPTGEGDLKMVHVTHHPLGHRKDLRNLPPSVLRKVANLTRVDRELYLVALEGILAEVAWLESPAALGRRVLCDDVIEKWEPELAYLDLSFASLYGNARNRSVCFLGDC